MIEVEFTCDSWPDGHTYRARMPECPRDGDRVALDGKTPEWVKNTHHRVTLVEWVFIDGETHWPAVVLTPCLSAN